LPFARGARWDHVDRLACLDGTRTEELKRINDWIHTENDRRIYLLTGLAGIGKSTISLSVASFAQAEGVLGASFFCSRDSDDRSNIGFIFPIIAALLSQYSPQFRAQLVTAVKEYPDIGHALPDEQLKRLIVEPLSRMGSFQRPVVIVVDALDECKDEKTPEKILLFRGTLTPSHPSNFSLQAVPCFPLAPLSEIHLWTD
jgi:ATP/maltotriose-dependent transcriptional regulator MalT